MHISLCMFCHSVCSFRWTESLFLLFLSLSFSRSISFAPCIVLFIHIDPLDTHKQRSFVISTHQPVLAQQCNAYLYTKHVHMLLLQSLLVSQFSVSISVSHSLKSEKPLNFVRNSRLPRKLYKYCLHEGKITRQHTEHTRTTHKEM